MIETHIFVVFNVFMVGVVLGVILHSWTFKRGLNKRQLSYKTGREDGRAEMVEAEEAEFRHTGIQTDSSFMFDLTAPVTMRMLLEKHPEVENLPIVVYSSDGYDWVGAAGTVYISEDDGDRIVVFSGN